MLERTVHIFGINIYLLILNSLISLVGFILFWISNLKIKNLKSWDSFFGNGICLISLVLWLIWKEMITFYLLGIAMLILNLIYNEIPDTRNSKKRSIFQKELICTVESYVFISLSLSFFIAVYLWKNLIFFIMFGIFCLLLVLIFGFIAKRKNSLVENKLKSNKLKRLVRDILLGVFPFSLASLLFVAFYGYLIFIPIGFSTAKLLISMIFAILAFIFAFLSIKNKNT